MHEKVFDDVVLETPTHEQNDKVDKIEVRHTHSCVLIGYCT